MEKSYRLYLSVLCLSLMLTLPITIIDAQGDECNGAMALALVIGEQGRVLPGSANRMRAQPSTSGAEVGQIPGGDSFTVVAEPVCADGFWWWQVNYNGVVGWTVQGTADED